ETTADDDGNVEVVVEGGGLADGEEYEVTATDKARDETDPTTSTGDTTAPEAPDVEDITNNFDDNGNVESTTVTGTAEPGSTVTIKDEDGNIVGETTADDDGNFEVVVEGGGLADGEEYEVTATDKAGNESDPTTITGDTTAPEAPDVEDITNNFDDNGKVGRATCTESAETGSTATIKYENGNIVGETRGGDDGYFADVVEGGGLADGEEYEVTATDKAGNESDPTTITGDTTAPEAPDVEDITNNFDDNG